MSAESIISAIIQREGAQFTDIPADSGGPTKYGITQADLAEHRGRPVSVAEVRLLTETEARAIYWKKYVVRSGFGQVIPLADKLADELIDTGVNCGVAVAAQMLQRSLNALNRQGKDYPDIPVDGHCGPQTLATLRRYFAVRGSDGMGLTVLLRALNSLQGAFYIGLAEGRPKDETFLFGWFANRVIV